MMKMTHGKIIAFASVIAAGLMTFSWHVMNSWLGDPVVHAQALLVCGAPADEVRAALWIGRERLLQQAAHLTSEAVRADFLRGLGENAELLRLAAQLAPDAAAGEQGTDRTG
mgnify:CR=1 FL=1